MASYVIRGVTGERILKKNERRRLSQGRGRSEKVEKKTKIQVTLRKEGFEKKGTPSEARLPLERKTVVKKSSTKKRREKKRKKKSEKKKEERRAARPASRKAETLKKRGSKGHLARTHEKQGKGEEKAAKKKKEKD